jgi:thiamine pyrophosphokinase
LSPLAFSNFLRQHDLVQVQWVILSFNISKHPSETIPDLKQIGVFVQVQKKYLKTDLPLRFEGVLVIVGGGVVDLVGCRVTVNGLGEVVKGSNRLR